MATFYLVKDLEKIGKIDNFVPFIYDPDNGWVVDNDNLLMDRVVGYDSESIGSTSMMLVEEIDEQQAMELIA